MTWLHAVPVVDDWLHAILVVDDLLACDRLLSTGLSLTDAKRERHLHDCSITTLFVIFGHDGKPSIPAWLLLRSGIFDLVPVLRNKLTIVFEACVFQMTSRYITHAYA